VKVPSGYPNSSPSTARATPSQLRFPFIHLYSRSSTGNGRPCPDSRRPWDSASLGALGLQPFQEGFKGGQKDPLIGLGTAPLDDPQFRAAMFEQLGEHRLEAAVTTDICGKPDSHAVRLEKEAVETLQKARLHRKVATAIFFESNGGKARAEATIPDSRLPWIAFRNHVTIFG
jgi:hypothetical protein